jgi:glyceraldehyde 3-phosphate dehydrogenase
MAITQIGLMGCGRIGRDIFRLLYKSEEMQVAAISDTADHTAVEYLLRFDTILGPFPDEISLKGEHIYVAGRQIPMLSGKEPGDVPWGDLGVDVVIEATGQARSKEELERHLKQGAKRVILCVRQKTPVDITVVMGVNDNQLKPEHKIVSNSTGTAQCAAPIVKILNDAFGIERAFLSTVHAYTDQQRLADVPSEDMRLGRAATENIIPQETNAAQVIAGLIPELTGRLTGTTLNVPVANGSVVDITCWHKKPVSVEAVNEVVRTAVSTDRWKRFIRYTDDPIVSSDILHSAYSGTFDSSSTMVLGNVSKTLSWYDNSWGYANRAIDLIRKFNEIEKEVQ